MSGRTRARSIARWFLPLWLVSWSASAWVPCCHLGPADTVDGDHAQHAPVHSGPQVADSHSGTVANDCDHALTELPAKASIAALTSETVELSPFWPVREHLSVDPVRAESAFLVPPVFKPDGSARYLELGRFLE